MEKPYNVKLTFTCYLAFLLLSIFWTTAFGFAAESTIPYKLRIGYSSVVGARIFLWAAHDAGHFAKNGIDSELVVVSGIQGIQALIAGDPPIFLGPTDTAVQAAAQGADVIILATAEPIPYKLIVQPNIKTPDDLKKKKLAIDRIGGTSYHLTLRMLEKLNIKPNEVELIPVAGGGSRRVLAVQSGAVSGVVTTIAPFEEQKIPYRVLADSIEMGIKIIGNSFITTKRFRDQNRAVIENFIRASIDARSWLMNRKNRDAAEKIFSRYLRTSDPSALSLNYRLYVEPLQLYPYTDIEDLKANLSLMPESNSLLRNVDLSTIVDNSFIRRVQQQAPSKR
jgi:ABC-type nitrate/sulfonate/bicarbonate transport system substrate-binding protein